jgi:transposase InsO family protein
VVAAIDEQWQADLADMHYVSKDNDGNNYILTCIDVLSRYGWAIPIRTKGAAHMLTAMRQLFKMAAPRKPKRLQTDKGVEFYNTQVRKFLREHGVELFSTNSDHKASVVEFNPSHYWPSTSGRCNEGRR